jgi:alkanesulfonate monooxygenase SsuD/methylene tetrahydromethanopterin reductase-like flavin-dependent oxidoreductase (luciferase family)
MRSLIGVQVGATTSPSDLMSIVSETEVLGFGEVWLAEDYFDLGGIASTAAALAATERIPVGLGVVAAAVRHPAATAMEFATLEGLFPARLMAGIGHGAPGWVSQMGLEVGSPVALLKEVTSAVKDLLLGHELNAKGDYFGFDRIRLRHAPRTPPPVYLGVHGPVSLRLSGALADGTLLGWFSSPAYVTWARERIHEGRDRAGRSSDHQLVALCVASISLTEPEQARLDAARWAGPILASMVESPQLKASTVRNELVAWLERGHHDSVPGEILDEFVAAGDPEQCQTMVSRLLDAGADRVVLVPNPAGFRSTSVMVEQIRIASTLLELEDFCA